MAEIQNNKSKKIGQNIVELTTWKNAGGSIKIWENGASRLEHVWSNNADKTMHCIEEVNFMYAQNAIEEYNCVTNIATMTDLMRANQ